MKFTLGQKGEYNKYKIYYFLFLVIVFIFLAWSAIGVGAMPDKARMVNYYMWLGFIALAFILFDNMTAKQFEQIDSVTIEDTPVHPKYYLIIGAGLAIFISWRIITTQTAFVPYPSFQLFDYRLPNAILSGVAGIIEDLFFFAFLLPTFYAFINSHFQNNIMSAVLSIIAIAFLFMSFHLFVYGTNQPALLMSFIFGLVSASLVLGTKSIIISHFLHFTNNLTASLIMAKVMILFV
jgi:membrane protease YdiL (CAAX protease family)